MTKEQFLKCLIDNNVNLDVVCFDDNIKDGVYCIMKNYFIWEVFYRERGKEYYMKKFQSESDALEYLLNEILRYKP